MDRKVSSVAGLLMLHSGSLFAQAPGLTLYPVPSTVTIPPPATCAAPVSSVVAVPPSRPCSLAMLGPPPAPVEPPPLVKLKPTHRPLDPAALQGLLRMGLCAATRGSC